MTQWYVKQLSQLTHISVQTLHHYDRIGLLKPSVRLPNGYRLYSEKDLSKLQQVIALKFFGFELSQIKLLLSREIDLLNNFTEQANLLEEKGKVLLQASQALQNVITECKRDKSIHWDNTIKLIEVYHMMSELNKTWAGKVFNKEELKEYASLQQDMKEKMSPAEIKSIEDEWDEVIIAVSNNLEKEPGSQIGIAIGKRCMDWVNKVYGNKFISLRNAVWEKGFKGGYITEELNIAPEIIAWLDKAIESYYRDRVWTVLSEIGKKEDAKVNKDWELLLIDMYGNDAHSQEEMLRAVLKETHSEEIKNWIKKYYNVS